MSGRNSQRVGQVRHQPEMTWGPVIAIGALFAVVLLAAGGAFASLWLGAKLDRRRAPGPFYETLIKLVTGKTKFVGSAWTVLWVLLGLLVLIVVLVIVLRVRSVRRRARVDGAAKHLGSGREITPLRAKTADQLAKRLHVGTPGLPLGETVGWGSEPLFFTWEAMALAIFGPRQGKSTSLCIPWIVQAPGCVLSTSNKRDVLDATRDVRTAGGPVWVFDLEGVAQEQPAVFWNPISYVTSVPAAVRLADVFVDAIQDANAEEHPYFGPERRSLLANMLLAAAVSGEPITQVFRWLAEENNPRPLEALRTVPGLELMADSLSSQMKLTPEQKKGVWAGALSAVAFLRDPELVKWITAGPGKREFDPRRFAADEKASTLYLLSKDRSPAGPVVTALSAAVMEAAEQLAERSGGRLRVPLVAVLDEAANICPWRQLPSLYSHYGSKGIHILTILQSYSQGEKVWGVAGMKTLYDASTVRIIGSGIVDPQFLTHTSELIGDYRVQNSSTSRDRHGNTSHSTQTQRERILDVATLASMELGRAVILSAGARPTLVKTLPWMKSKKHAAAIAASIAAHDPSRIPADQVIQAAWEKKWPQKQN